MRNLLHGVLVGLAVVPLVLARAAPARAVPLDVEFKLTDPDYRPLAGVPIRLDLRHRRLAGARCRNTSNRHRGRRHGQVHR